MSRPKKTAAALAAVALTAAALLSGCTINLGSSGDQAQTDVGPGSMMNDGGSMMNDDDASDAGQVDGADVMFAQMMIPHHEQAVEMSTLAETRASDPFIKQLAADIKAAQQPEIDQMSGWLDEWGAPVMNGMDAMSAHGGHGMAGMLSDEELDALAAATGAEFDRLYAEGMIAHHEGAIQMAEPVSDSSDPRVADLANAIITAQEREIALMREFLAEG